MQVNKIESGVQLFSRILKRSALDGINPLLFPNGGPYPDQSIEIISEQGVDKDNLIVDIIVRCILPTELHKDYKGSVAVLIITEFKITIFQIVKAIEKHVNNSNVGKKSKFTVIENALKKLILFKCYTPEEFECTLYNLERLIYSKTDISLVVLDDICPFYWKTRKEKVVISFMQYCSRNFRLIRKVLKDLKIVFVFGNREKHLKNMCRISKEINIRFHIVKSLEQAHVYMSNYENNETISVPCIY